MPVRDEDAFQHVVRTQVVEYLAEMGVHAEVANIMDAIPHDRIRDLTVDEALRLNLADREALNPGERPRGWSPTESRGH